MNSIPKSVPDSNIVQPVITYRYIPVNWTDGSTSHVPIVSSPTRQPESLTDRPIIIHGLDTRPGTPVQAVA